MRDYRVWKMHKETIENIEKMSKIMDLAEEGKTVAEITIMTESSKIEVLDVIQRLYAMNHYEG